MTKTDRYQVITWARGNHGISDTKFPIGDQRRRLGMGFAHRRKAEQYARELNRKAEQEVECDEGS